ncbi:MAG: site-specific integrase [Thermomicrobiales bacterium]|nr:site-specific integrase [Thermomicrobiales bacterium]
MTQHDANDASALIVSGVTPDAENGGKPEKKRPRRGRGDDSIYQRGSDGRWIVEIRSVRKPTGRPYYLSASTESEARKKLRAWLAERARGIRPIGKRQTVEGYLTTWLETRVWPTLTYSTWRSYESLARIHVIPEIGRVRLADLTAEDIDRMLLHRQKAGVSGATLNSVRTMLRKALNDAEKRGDIDRNPVKYTNAPRRARFDPSPLTETEIPRFLDAIAGHRLEAFFMMAMTLGLREGELFGLQWGDIDLDRGELMVRRQIQRQPDATGARVPVFLDTKTHRSKRPLPIPANVRACLLSHHGEQEMDRIIADDRWQGDRWGGLVFCTTIGTPLDPSNVSKSYKQVLDDAGLPRRRFHDLRATCATMLARLGAAPRDAQLIMGHAQLSTTLSVYTQATEQGVRESVDKLGDFMDRSGGKKR